MEYIIYKIQIGDNANLCYVGSTNKLTRRIYQHKINSINDNKLKLYQTINQNGGWDNCTVSILETINVNDVKEARQREEELRMEHNATLNSIKAYIKEDIVLYHKEYIQRNKEHMQVLWRKNYEKNKDKILQECCKKYAFKKELKRLSNINL
jgi:hypothetical protein